MEKTSYLTASDLLEMLNNPPAPTENAPTAHTEKRKPRPTKAGELLHTLRNRSSRRAGPFLRDA